MKTLSIFIVVGLIALPPFLRVIIVLYRFLTKGKEGLDSELTPSQTRTTFKSRHKILFWLIVLLYPIALVSAIVWAFLEVTTGLGENFQVLIVFIVAVFVLLGWIIGLGINDSRKFLKHHPPPATGASSDEYMAWRNAVYDETTHNSWEKKPPVKP
jgi:hypothetical protein